MSRQRSLSMTATAFLVGILAYAFSWGLAQTPPPQRGKLLGDPTPLSKFMRQKLQGSNHILEGLALEDMDLIKAGASQLHQLSSEEQWRISRDPLYRQFSEDFQRHTAELQAAAEKNNLDQAALKWIAVTMNCIECHRFARNQLMAGPQGGRP